MQECDRASQPLPRETTSIFCYMLFDRLFEFIAAKSGSLLRPPSCSCQPYFKPLLLQLFPGLNSVLHSQLHLADTSFLTPAYKLLHLVSYHECFPFKNQHLFWFSYLKNTAFRKWMIWRSIMPWEKCSLSFFFRKSFFAAHLLEAGSL